MADIFDEIDINTESGQKSGDIFDSIEYTPNNKTSIGKEILNASLGLGALGLAGTGVVKGGQAINNYMQAPQKLLNPIEAELGAMQQKIPSMQGMRFQDIPKRIQSQMAEQRLQIKDFDDLTLSTSAENLASSVKSAFPKLRESNSSAYGNVLKNSEELMIATGSKLNTTQFDTEVIQKAIEDSIKKGVPEDQLSKLKRLSNRDLSPIELKVLGIKGEKQFKFKDISLTQAKGYLKNITKDLPSDTQRAISNNWGKFLEKNAPPEVAQKLSQANTKYADFIAQEETLKKFIDSVTKEYDYDKLYRYTLQRAKTRINSDFKNLMSGLSQIEPEVGTKAKDLYTLRAKRIEMQRGLNSLRTWLTKAEELVSKREALLEKYPQRLKGASKLLGDAGKTVARGLLFKGLGGLALGSLDPSFAVMKQTTGLDPIETINMLRTGKRPKISEEEFKRWQEANAI